MPKDISTQLTHLDESGRARMVDVGTKPETERVAVAKARIRMQPSTLEAIRAGNVKKGDVLTVAQVAGIQAAKRTHELIPMCHPLLLTYIGVSFDWQPEDAAIQITATVRTTGKTGVEMEALTAANVAALTIYDMAKAIDRGMRIDDIHLALKTGGKSGDFLAEEG
jgi:cyclic pyranopterin phosphate synthase